MIGQLDEREGIELLAQTPQWNAPTEGRWGKASTHIGKWRRRRNGLGLAKTQISILIAVQRNSITAKEPVAKLRLPLSEQLKVEVPNTLDGLHPVVGMFLMGHYLLKVSSGWF